MNLLLQSHGIEFPKKKVSLQKILGAFSILVFPFMLWGNQALAGPVYGTSATLTGTRDNTAGGGLIGSAGWDGTASANNFVQVEWVITDNNDGTFFYEYTWSGAGLNNNPGAISHFTLDVTDDCVNSMCIFDVSPINNFPTDPEFGDLDGITGAVKFDNGGSNSGLSPTTYSFTSNRDPVYRDLCLKDGGGGGQIRCETPFTSTTPILIKNAGFGDQTVSMNPFDYIAGPNGATGVIPEPSTMLLLGSGLAGLVAWRMRKGRA